MKTTNKPTHTPGPWNVTPSSYGHGRYIAVRSKEILAPIADNILLEEDARLIAAGPELLAVARETLETIKELRLDCVDLEADIIAAIAKAEGK